MGTRQIQPFGIHGQPSLLPLGWVGGDAPNPAFPRGQGPAVRILVGAADVRGKFRRWPQNEAAIAALQKLGHRRVEYVKVENRAHERFTDKVFAFIDGVRK